MGYSIHEQDFHDLEQDLQDLQDFAGYEQDFQDFQDFQDEVSGTPAPFWQATGHSISSPQNLAKDKRCEAQLSIR